MPLLPDERELLHEQGDDVFHLGLQSGFQLAHIRFADDDALIFAVSSNDFRHITLRFEFCLRW